MYDGRPITFFNAQIVGSEGVFANALRVERGRVAGFKLRTADVRVDVGGAFIYPGLVNAHDHLELNNFPRLKWRERYTNAREWIADFQPRFESDPALAGPMSIPLADRLFIGGIKNLLSGATTVCHHNPFHRSLRRDFPVRVVTRRRYSHSLLIDGGERVAREYRDTPRNWPWIIHAAEGTDAEAAGELDRLDRLGCLWPNTVLVHGVNLSERDCAKLAERGGGLVWCPASNHFLLGATAGVRDLARLGRVALGSDSRLSGARDLLAELKCAAATGQVDARALFRMVTVDAAALLRLPQAGRLAPRLPADLLALRAPPLAGDPFRALLAVERKDLLLVMIGGRPAFGAPELARVFAAGRVKPRPVRVDGTLKLMDQSLAGRLQNSAIGEPGVEWPDG
ncbi:MAG: amidohydrolase family protein [Anaerolineales bacterium]